MHFSSLVLALNAPAHSFPVRIVTLRNHLPAATALSGSLQNFKKSIEDINFNYALLGKY